MRTKLKRNKRRFQFVDTCGKEETITVCRNSYKGGPLFEGLCGLSREDWDALVKWVDAGKTPHSGR
jgi:hypothetical protein